MSRTHPLASEVYSASDLTQDAVHQLALAYEKSACTAAELDRHCIGYRDALAADRASPPPGALAAVAGQGEQVMATTDQLVTLFEQRSMAV